MDEQDRWLNPLDAERDAEVEHLAARELAHRERLDEKGLPHAFVCEPCECGGLCDECAEAA